MVRALVSQVTARKNGSIRDFFKPFVATQPSVQKRPIPETDTIGDDGPRRSKSPKLTPELPPPALPRESSSCKSPKLPQQRAEPSTPIESSSGLSTLTPIQSDETVEVPTDLLTPSPTPEIAQQASRTSSSSFTQPSIPSSQRIVKYGEVIVRNSDDESDSDSSLADLDDILKPFMKDHAASLSSPPLESESTSEEKSTRKQPARGTKKTKSYYKAEEANANSKDYDYFDGLLARTRKTAAEDEAYARALQLAQDLENRAHAIDSESSNLQAEALTQEDLISRINEGDSENTDKFVQAMQRTEALRSEHEWYIFSQGGPSVTNTEVTPMPIVKNHSLSPMLKNSVDKEAAFLNGTVALAASIGDLPEDLLEWILTSSSFELREDLRQAYLTVLESLENQVSQKYSESWVRNSLIRLGASTVALEKSQQVKPVSKLPNKHVCSEAGWQAMEHWLHMISIIAQW